MVKPSESTSWYGASARAPLDYPALEGERTVDVCIIGAGYTGLSAALELAKAGRRVVVLEAERVGFGASGRNGGQICTGFSPGQGPVRAQVGRDDARKCFALAEEAKLLLEERIRTHKIECDLTWGYLHCAPKQSMVRELKQMEEEWRSEGYEDIRFLGESELQAKLATRAYRAALREGRGGHFHALDYCQGLARAAREAGAEIFERTRVLRCETEGAPRAWTTSGEVRAKYMIIACNAYIGRLVNRLFYAMMPVTSFVAATQRLGPERARSLIPDNEAVADTNWVVDYFRRTSDNRLLFGGRASYSTIEPPDLKISMKSRLTRIFPQLSDVTIDYAWGGWIAITHNRLPDLGRIGTSTYYAHGYSGQGVALANLYGKLMAEVIRGQSERFDLLARFRHFPFPGGPVRLPILIAAMAWYRLKDALA
jgi:gamma-glutamylputrescine oxidase